MLAIGVLCGVLGCGQAPASPAPPAPPDASTVVPEGLTRRVGGDLQVATESRPDGYACGKLKIDTPLPVGYPAPTPPGAIELKGYPSVRRAEISGTGSTDAGQSRGFWPLFQHIKKREIAMTAPVEMELQDWAGASESPPTAWTMAFLYRSADLGPTGADGRVVVRDADPVTVIAIGVSGGYKQKRFDIALGRLEEWLVNNPEWRRAGEARWLGYNNPTWFQDEWSEVQIPIEPVEVPDAPISDVTPPIQPAVQTP